MIPCPSAGAHFKVWGLILLRGKEALQRWGALLSQARNNPEAYRRIVQYNSYLRYLLDRIGQEDPRLLKNFGVILVQSKDERIYAIVHPYLHASNNPNITVLAALKLLSRMQQAVQGVGMKPPGRIIVSYPYHKLKTPGGFELLTVLPHPFYRQRIPKSEIKAGAKKIIIPLSGLNLWLRYWHRDEARLANLLAEYGRKYPGILANSVLESVGAIYVMEHLGTGLPIQSLRLTDVNGENQTEYDMLVIGEGPRIDIYEVKASDGLEDPHYVIKKKLNSQHPSVQFLSSFGFPIGYHIILVGRDEEALDRSFEAAREVLGSHPIPATERSVHGVLVHRKGFRPHRVEVL